jgi:formylglycine-generating enzyme required for sulfatase activity
MAWFGNNSGRKQLDSDAMWRTDPQNYAKRLRDNHNQSHPVGQKQSNGFGLYDMQGNVTEWCQDWSHDSYDGAPTDGTAWSGSGAQKYRILRGGSWGLDSYDSRVAARDSYYPVTRALIFGFRVVAVQRTESTNPRCTAAKPQFSL